MYITTSGITLAKFSSRSSLRTTKLFGLGSGAIRCKCGLCSGLCPTDAAGLVATCLTFGCNGVSSVMAISSDISDFTSSRMIYGLRPNSAIALCSLLYNLLLHSNGSYNITVTRRVSKDMRTFTRLVGSRTGTLNTANDRFIGPRKLRGRGRCAATCSLCLVFGTYVRSREFVSVVSVSSCAVGLAKTSNAAEAFSMIPAGCCSSKGVGTPRKVHMFNNGANAASRTKYYIVLCDRSLRGGPCVSVVVKTRSGDFLCRRVGQLLRTKRAAGARWEGASAGGPYNARRRVEDFRFWSIRVIFFCLVSYGVLFCHFLFSMALFGLLVYVLPLGN